MRKGISLSENEVGYGFARSWGKMANMIKVHCINFSNI